MTKEVIIMSIKSPDKSLLICLVKDIGIGYPPGTTLVAEAKYSTLAKADILAGYYVRDSEGDLFELEEKDIGKKFKIIKGRYISSDDFGRVISKNPRASYNEYEKYFN